MKNFLVRLHAAANNDEGTRVTIPFAAVILGTLFAFRDLPREQSGMIMLVAGICLLSSEAVLLVLQTSLAAFDKQSEKSNTAKHEEGNDEKVQIAE